MEISSCQVLTSGNLEEVKKLLTVHWQRVLACYQEEHYITAGHKERYLKAMEKRFSLDILVS